LLGQQTRVEQGEGMLARAENAAKRLPLRYNLFINATTASVRQAAVTP